MKKETICIENVATGEVETREMTDEEYANHIQTGTDETPTAD